MFLPLLIATMKPEIDIRGPIQSFGKAPIVRRQSIQMTEPVHSVSPNDAGPGIAKWVWLDHAPKDVPVRFRKTFQLEKVPSSVRGWITAEVRYRMWINGKLAGRGPADAGRDYDSGPCGPWFEDARDLTPYFRTGINTIAIEVFPTPLVSSDAMTGRPGLKAEWIFREPSGWVQAIGTDTSWKSQPALDLGQTGASNGFRMDMSQEPVGWQLPGYDDLTWLQANEAPQARRSTIISELPPPMEAIVPNMDTARATSGVQVRSNGSARFTTDGSYTVRYGHVLSGYVGLKVSGHVGARLEIMPNEHDAPGWNRRSEILLREGIQYVELPYFDSFSVINLKAAGVTRPVEIQDVRTVFTSFPVQYRGDFSCSNPEWNRVWQICRWVTQICMQTHHLDSPHHQEPISDAGDYLIESLNSFYAFGEGTLARQDLKKIARTLAQRHYQSFHTSYSLLWLRMLIQYYEYTGDADTVRELSPYVFALLDQFESYIGANGLISEAPNYMFLDWVEIEGFNTHHPPAVIGQGYMTALYYQALGDGQTVAEMVKDQARSAKFGGLRTSVSQAFDRELWSGEKGLYRDGKPFQTHVKPNDWLPADKAIETFSTQVNALAVSCGLTSKERSAQVMKSVMSRKDLNCQPYFMHFVFEALLSAGIYSDEAKAQIDRWKIVPDTQSFHEMWTVGDLSHAWNATPMFQMSGRILGVTPSKSSFSEFRITPIPCGLQWAKGTVPTIHGVIEVSWRHEKDGLSLDFTVPKGTHAIVGGRSYPPGHHQAKLSH